MRITTARGWRAGIAALVALSLAAAACGDSADDDAAAGGDNGDTPTTAGGSDEGALDTNAVLNVTNDGPSPTLDPHAEPTQGATPYWTPAYDTITDIALAGEIRPRLAESWEFSEDGLSLVLQIRDGVSFHDGTPLDANAVKVSLDRARSADLSTQKNVLASVTDVQATGPSEVTLILSDYDPALPSVLGTAAGAVVNPSAIESGADLAMTTDGSGAYVVTEFEPNVSASYERADNPPWDPETGKLAGFTINALTDYQVALNGLQAGQYDMIRLNGLGGAVDQVVTSSDFVRTELPSLQTLAFWLNNQDPAFQDVRVRQAFQYAIDREGIANAAFDQGSECAPTSQMYPFQGDGLYVEGYEPYTYDPDRAGQLLEEADAVGTRITITDIGGTNTGNLMQAAQPQLETVGFEVELQRGTAAEVAPAFQRNEVQVAVIPHAKQAHPTITLKRYWLTGGPYHLAQNEDQEILAMLETINDPAAADDAINETNERIARHLAEDVATLVVACDIVWSMVHDERVVDVDPDTLLLNMRVVGAEQE